MNATELETSPLPWDLIEATEHHGPYIVNAYGGTVCDFYAMSNPLNLSIRNGGDSAPISFTCADGNAALAVRAVNMHGELIEALESLLSDSHSYESEGQARDKASAALSKAKGAPP
jgi:hypothetical protein